MIIFYGPKVRIEPNVKRVTVWHHGLPEERLHIFVYSFIEKILFELRNDFSGYGPRQANLVLIAYASSEGSGEPAHPRSLARTFAARIGGK